MVTTKRSKENPILTPNILNSWEAEAVFHGNPIKEGNKYKMAYRALSIEHLHQGKRLKLSTIGISQSGDGIHYKKRRQIVKADKSWDLYGCEDPRVTLFEDMYYIFYTALSAWHPDKDSIKVAVALSKDLNSVTQKHLVTPFNAKAMALFPERVNGKIAAVLTVNTDKPPAKICLALFDNKNQIWDEKWWNNWYKDLDDHTIPIYHTPKDHLEVGAVPVKTPDGWVLVFCYIENYFGENRVFRIDAALLDLDNPLKLRGQTLDPLLIPEKQYEIYGMVPNVIFPSGAFVEEGQFFIYYSACDTTVCRASITYADLLAELKENPIVNPHQRRPEMLVRFDENPIISPIKENRWESKYTFNAGAIYAGDKVHILYRAMGEDETSTFGYAVSNDGFNIDKRLPAPVYIPREPFEMKYKPGFSGCEDPRITKVGNTIFICYTAYDGINPPRIALTSIEEKDFLANHWNWTVPKLISAPAIDNKDSCILPEKRNGKFVFFHRIPPCIWVDYVTDCDFGPERWLGGHPIMMPRVNSWDNLKIGLNGPPEKTDDGWLLLYHGVSKKDMKYRLGAALLDLKHPMKILARLHNPILEPLAWYENEGFREGTVFSNGQVIKDGILYVYYGGADKYTCVATTPMDKILNDLKKGK